MVHAVRLEGGKAACYRNRYVKTPYLANPEISRVSPQGKSDYTASSANTHIIRHAGKLMALEEGGFPFILDEELETHGYENYGGKLAYAMTAHPKICPVTGELLFYSYNQLPPYLLYHRVSRDGRLVQTEEISVGGPTMMHDFAITERHAIFMDLPVVFDLQLAIQGLMPFHWSDDYPARIGIMPREGNDAQLKWFDVNPCFVFHGLNAYEEGAQVVFDVCRSSEIWRNAGQMDGGSGKLSFHRFTFDLEGGGVKEETLDDRAVEFPRVADARVGRKSRHGFTVELGMTEGGQPGFAGHLKYDLETGSSERHTHGPGRTAGEAVFVPGAGTDPNAGEGWLLSFVYDEATNASELAIMDTTRFSGAAVARIKLPQRVPFGFHGSWFADD